MFAIVPERPAAFARRATTSPVYDAFFQLLARPWMPWTLSALIAGTALALWLDFRLRRVEPVLRGLDDAIAAVEEAEGPGAFRRRFGSVFQRLAETPVLGEVWRAYAPTIAPAPGQEDALGYPRRPQESINEGLLALAGVNLRFYHAVPNLLVGTGLLFTFLGLVAALYFASRGVAAAAVQEAQAALRELLSAATFKFVTSIAGLGSWMLCSWREKAVLYRLRRRLAALCAALEARMVPLTAESIGIAQLAELRLQQQELQKLGRSLLVKVPETVEERLAEELAAAIHPLRQATAAAAGRLARIDEWLLDIVVDAAEAEGKARGEAPGARALPVLERLEELIAAVRTPQAQEATAARAASPPQAREELPELLDSSRSLLRTVDSRLGETLLRVRELVGKLGGGKRPSRADVESASRLFLEAQGSLQQAKAASVRLAERLERLVRDGDALLAAGGDAPGYQAVRQEVPAVGQELRHTRVLLDAGTGGAAERLALAAGRLGGPEGG